MNHQQSITSLLHHSNGQLKKLLNKTKQLRKLDQDFQTILDPQLTKHCKIANLRNDCLIIIADNATWATRIRYMAPDLLEKLKNKPNFQQVKTIRCIIRTD